MSLILHLSDLHLGSPSPFQRDYEDKVGIDDGSAEAGDTAADHLNHTLAALGESLSQAEKKLDAVVVTGDLTKANKPDGYEAVPGILEKLGDAGPPDDQIVVIPGNHDVDDLRRAGDPEKLARFMDATRDRYATPLIKGLDYKGSDLQLNPSPRKAPHPILELEDAVIVAINSADYCFIEGRKTKTEWDEVLGSYLSGDESEDAKTKRDQAALDLRKLRTHDIAKVDKRQIEALGNRLDEIGVGRDDDPDADPRLRIAAIHHPITPASGQEEIKPFEVITNLAAVRTFLYHRGFHLVLHGHKHASYAAWDWLVPPRDNLDLVPRRALILGAPARFRPGEPICRLIEVCPDGDKPVPGAPRLRFLTLKGVDGSGSLDLPLKGTIRRSLAQPAFTSQDRNTPWVVQGKSADAVYQQLRDLQLSEEAHRPVIAVVDDPESTSELPTNYPEREGVPSLKDIVDWWQHPRPEAVQALTGSKFNHGERLYGYGDHDNQIAKAVEALPSSKAFALLVRPNEPGSRQQFPAFSEVQLQVRKKAPGKFSIDVVGVYRKQDLKLWWPVNMAELARIQRGAVDAANDSKPMDGTFESGRLVAIASQGVHEDVLPEMAGTALDRAVDLRPQWIYRLAYLGAQPDPSTEVTGTIGEWRKALFDIGERTADGLLVPSIGLQRLLDALGTQREAAEEDTFRVLVEAVEKLRERAKQAESSLRSQSNPHASTLDSLGAELKELVDQCEKALDSRVAEVAP